MKLPNIKYSPSELFSFKNSLRSEKTNPSLTDFGLVSSAISVVVFLTASIILFGKYYKNISPSLKFINLKYSSDLEKLGLQFFVIQISSLIVFTTGNIIFTKELNKYQK